MTIPTLMAKIDEKTTVNKLKSTYAIFSQAAKLAISENGDIDGWDLAADSNLDSSEKLYNYFKPYLKRARDCDRSAKKGCFASNYKAMFGDSDYAYQPDTISSGAKSRGVLLNGVSFRFWSEYTGCYDDAGTTYCGSIHVDINGLSKPNRAGVDYFIFRLTPNSVVPAYNDVNNKSRYGLFCQYNNTSNKNGTLCTGWVIKHGNMDYLRKDVTGLY